MAPTLVDSFFLFARLRGTRGVTLACDDTGTLAQKFILWSSLILSCFTGGVIVGPIFLILWINLLNPFFSSGCMILK